MGHLNFSQTNANDSKTILSQSLFATGKQIQRECIKAKRNLELSNNFQSRDDLLKTMGKLEGFIQVSRTLCNKVNIGNDTRESEAILQDCQKFLSPVTENSRG